MIRTQAVSKTIATDSESISILDRIDLTIASGQTAAITGASGSGKSTLLGILAGLDLPSSGQVWLDDREITAMDENQRAGIRSELVGFIFQSFQLLPALTALENVMLPLELKKLSGARRQAEIFLERVGLGHRLRHYPRQLSGGEQQRVAIARAFATQPKLLFADEPTGNLDVKTGGSISDLLFELNRDAGTTLVLVTHDLGLTRRCGCHFELQDGRLAAAEPVQPAVAVA
jgi:putative ABC transport system ATP-binding protein